MTSPTAFGVNGLCERISLVSYTILSFFLQQKRIFRHMITCMITVCRHADDNSNHSRRRSNVFGIQNFDFAQI